KVPDVTSGPQLGFQATLFPTAQEQDGVIISVNPDALNPVLVTTTWTGDLGLDEGVPQNVYFLDTENMEMVTEAIGEAEVGVLTTSAVGQSAEIPGGYGTIEFVDLARFAALDMRYDPTLGW